MTRHEANADPANAELATRGQRVALIIALTMILWIGVQLAGAQFGLAPIWAFAFDIAAMAAFSWALWNGYRIWKHLRDEDRHAR